MSTRLACFTLAIALTACTATPELKFSGGDNGDGDATTAETGAIDATADARKPSGGRDAQGGGVDDAPFAEDAPTEDDGAVDGKADAGTVPDADHAPDAHSGPDTSVPDVFVPDSAPPADSGSHHDASPIDAAPVCTPNLSLGIDCCPNGDQCVGLACQNCQDCTSCGLPDFCCANVNGAGKYKSMKCSPTPVGCP